MAVIRLTTLLLCLVACWLALVQAQLAPLVPPNAPAPPMIKKVTILDLIQEHPELKTELIAKIKTPASPAAKKTTTKKLHIHNARIPPGQSSHSHSLTKVKAPTPAKLETPLKPEEAKVSSDAVVAEDEQLPNTTAKPKRRGFNLPRRGGSRAKAQKNTKTENTVSQPTTVERTRSGGRLRTASRTVAATAAKPSTPQRNARFRPSASRSRNTARVTEAPSVPADDVAVAGIEPAAPSGRGTPRIKNGRSKIPARRQLRGRTTTPSPESAALPEEEVTKPVEAEAKAEPSKGSHRNARRFPSRSRS